MKDKNNIKHYNKLIKKYIKEVMGEYYSDRLIDYRLNKIKSIEVDKTCYDLNCINFNNGVLVLPTYFSNMDNVNHTNIAAVIEEYPEIKDYLSLVGLYIISDVEKDNEENQIINRCIIDYFINKNNELKDVSLGNIVIKSKTDNNSINENIIDQIAIIFGQHVLYDTLNNGIDNFIKEIDKKTNKNGTGRKLVDDIISIYSMTSNVENMYEEYTSKKNIAVCKLIPLYESIKNYDKKYINAILNIIEMQDFDFSFLDSIDPQIDIDTLSKLTNEEKNTVREMVKYFKEQYDSMNDYCTEYPHIKESIDDDGNTIFDKHDFTFINRYITSLYAYEDNYNKVCEMIKNKYREINEYMMWNILPRYIKNNKQRQIDLKELIKLSNFRTNNYNYEIENQSKTKNIIKKLKNK